MHQQGLVEAAVRKADVVILDLFLPDIDGVDVVKRLCEWSEMPIIVLSARAHEDDKVAALAMPARYSPIVSCSRTSGDLRM